MNRIKKTVTSNCFIAGMLTAVTFLLILSYTQVLWNGKNIILTGDLYPQYASFAALLARKIKEGSYLFYTFEEGMGTNTALLFAFYSFSPVNVIYLLIKNIELATLLVLTLKCSFAAAAFAYYCEQNLKSKSRMVIFFAIPYALCSYQFAMMKIATLSDALYLLPLVLVFVDRLVKQKCGHKTRIFLTLIYAVIFMCNFYSAYIVGLASFGYFVICIIMKNHWKDKKTRRIAGIFFQYCMCVLVAILIAAVVLVPTAYYALKMNAQTIQTFEYQSANIMTVLCSVLGFRDYAMNNNAPYLYCGIPAMLLFPQYFINRRVAVKEKILVAGSLLLLLLGIICSPLYFILHMMNRPDGYTVRFAYVIVFILMTVAVRQWENRPERKTHIVIFWPILLCGFAILLLFGEQRQNQEAQAIYQPVRILINIICIVIWLMLFLLRKQIKKEKHQYLIAIVLIMLETGLGGYLILSADSYMNRDYYYDYDVQAKNAITSIQTEDSDLYRLLYVGSINQNMQSLYGYHGIGFFSSTKSEALSNTMFHLGYVSSGFVMYEMGRTDVTNLLFAEKYEIDAAIPLSGESYNIIKKDSYLSYGYMVDEDIMEADIQEDNAFLNLNSLVDAMTGMELESFTLYSGDVQMETENASVVTEEDGWLIQRLDDDILPTYVKLKIPHVEGKVAYAYLTSDYNETNPTSPTVRTIENHGAMLYTPSYLTSPHIIEMENEGEVDTIYIFLPPEAVSQYTVRNIYFAYYDGTKLDSIYDCLSPNQLVVSEYQDGFIRGTVTATEDKPYLFLSIPYEDGWKVYVDGNVQPIVPMLNNSFLGVTLQPGEHEIELRYIAPGSRIGIGGSLLGCGLLVIWGICGKILQGKKENER